MFVKEIAICRQYSRPHLSKLPPDKQIKMKLAMEKEKRKLLKMTKILKTKTLPKSTNYIKFPPFTFLPQKEICDLTRKKSHNDSRYFFCEIERRFCKVTTEMKTTK